MSQEVPVMTTTAFSHWGYVIGIGVALLILGVAFFIYYRERMSGVVSHKSGSFSTVVSNKTIIPFDLYTSSGMVTIQPHDDHAMKVGLYEEIRADGVTPSGTKLTFTMKPTDTFNALYITYGGFGTSKDSNPGVVFANTTQENVMFVLVSKYGGSRFPFTVPAVGTLTNNTVIIDQKWQVVSPKDSSTVLAETIVREIPSVLSYDGKSLTAH